MQTMELVDVEDVYPYEEHDVRMNPRDVTSAECRQYIAQLAEQFKRNRLNPGQPRVRPILYRDGGVYMIVDGECRYEAMKLIGTKRFYADVFDDLDDAEEARREAAKAMVETDAKRALTPEELSRGVQQMLALDVPDEEIAASARIDAERVRRARRGARAVDDAAYDMTLDRLMAIAEFEGDDEAVAALRDCPQREWRSVYDGLVDQRALREATGRAVALCESRGLSEHADGDGTSFAACVTLDAHAEERIAALIDGGCTAYEVDGRFIEMRAPETGGDPEDPAREERKRARERAREEWAVESAAFGEWIAERIADPQRMRVTARLLASRARKLADGIDGAGIDWSPTGALAAIGWCRSWRPDDWTAACAATGTLSPYQLYGDRAEEFAELAAAAAADGYEWGEVGEKIVDALGKEAGDER